MCVRDVADALGDEVESFTEAPDEPSVWEGDGTDVSTSSWTTPTTRSLQAEREIRWAGSQHFSSRCFSPRCFHFSSCIYVCYVVN